MRKSLSKLSNETGIPVAYFRFAIGTPIETCTARTSKAAWAAYNDAPDWSEEEISTITRCMQLCKTVGAAKRANARVTLGSPAERIVHTRWDELSWREIDAAKTLEDTISAYRGTREGSDPEMTAIRNIYALYTRRRASRRKK